MVKKIAIFLFAMLFLLAGVNMAIITPLEYSIKKARCTLEVTAEVTDFEKSSHENEDGGAVYAPVYSFKVSGRTYTVKSPIATSSPPELESTAVILVNPDDPNEIYPAQSLDKGMVFLRCAGAAFILFALLILFLSVKKGKALFVPAV